MLPGGTMDLSTLLKYSRKNLRFILIVVLCCALIAGVIKSVYDYTSYSIEKQSQPALQSKLNELDLQYKSILSQLSTFNENSEYKFLKDIDSTSLQKYTVVYYIDRNVVLYGSAANDMNLLQKALTENNIEVPYEIARLLIEITATKADNILTINVYAEDAQQLKQLKLIATQCLEKSKETVKATVGESNIYMLSQLESVSSNTSLVALQKKYKEQYTSLSASVDAIETQFAEASKALSAINYSFLSKDVLEYTLLGFILGIFLAYLFILSRFYLSRKLIGIEQILPKVPLLASDANVSKVSLASVVPIIYACGNTTEQIGIVSSESLTETKDIFKYLKNNTDYNLKYIENIFINADKAKTLLECKGIILVEKYKASDIKKIERLLEICKNNSMSVYGAIIIE